MAGGSGDCRRRPVIVRACAANTRAWTGAVEVTRSIADSPESHLRCRVALAARENSPRRRRALAARTSPTCRQADSTYRSWLRRTTSAPRPAATRSRGSRFVSRSHGGATVSRVAAVAFAASCPYTGGPTTGGGSAASNETSYPASTSRERNA